MVEAPHEETIELTRSTNPERSKVSAGEEGPKRCRFKYPCSQSGKKKRFKGGKDDFKLITEGGNGEARSYR